MNISRRGVRALAMAVASLLMVSMFVPVASATTGNFTVASSSGRPGYHVKITGSDPCPVLPGVNQMVRVTFTDSANNSTPLNLSINPSTGEWDSGYQVKVPPSAAGGAGYISTYCYNMSGYAPTYQYDNLPYTVVGSAPEFATQARVARGERLFMESLEPCPLEGTMSVQANLHRVSGGGVHNISAMLWWDSSWKVNWIVPTNLPLGQYTTHIICYGEQLVEWPVKQIEVVNTPQHVGLGDSFSSGLGAGSYTSESKGCHRSTDAYAFFVADEKGYGTPSFGACSGARTADYYESNPVNRGEGPQQGRLQSATQKVTLTLGGNDAGFGYVMNECAHHAAHTGWGCKNNTSLVNTTEDRLAALAGTEWHVGDDGRQIYPFKQLYKDIAASAPNAKIFVGGYPKLFGGNSANYDTNSAAPSGKDCDLTAFVSVDYDDAVWLNSVADDLNTVISDAVTAAHNEGANVYFVPAALFAGHGLCDNSEPWFTPVILTGPSEGWPPRPTQESLHPLDMGQSFGYGEAFVSAINYYN